MMDELELIETLSENTDVSCFKLGTVVELFKNGTAKVQFDGEGEASEKEYSYLASYIPEIGHRVLLAKVSNTYILMDNIKYMEKIDNNEQNEINKQKITTRDLVVTGNANIQNIRHIGEIGFFGANRLSRKIIVNTLNNNSSQAMIIYKLNEIINAFKNYGLI